MTATIRSIIVDDEEHARITLRYALSKFPEWTVLAELKNAATAREYLAQYAVDVVFLDIQMPKESGLELVQNLLEQGKPPLIIFVTAYNAHAIDAFDLHALDYLLKPFNAERFAKTLARAREMLDLTRPPAYGQALAACLASGLQATYPRQVTVRSIGEMESILLSEVYWMGAAGNYVELHLDRRVVLHRVALSKLEEYLDPRQFVRVHRSVIVRADQPAHLQVLGNGGYQLSLRNGAEVPVSKNYVEIVRQLLLNPV
ncbi:LytR/AlgR family response regulator transcription factor [Undibacterium pigrum]|uniref:LytTR family two component transcriptional regulator n=1 Tax=Undibacterium pigrum TaxID=401470 RepID=A0A318JDK4_9BURK|nr:LytTR family DNA-binding domain-containing protein [Undibacterium pigrum]PXX45164.1 LytTR family two component transcriptional regulator [Undibacterium pigrum]